MEDDILTRYDHLVPKDQLVVDAVIYALSNKEQDCRRLMIQMQDILQKMKGPGE